MHVVGRFSVCNSDVAALASSVRAFGSGIFRRGLGLEEVMRVRLAMMGRGWKTSALSLRHEKTQ